MTPRDLGIRLAGLGADPDWYAAAIAVVRWLATRRHEFTTDAVWFVLDRLGGIPPTPEPRAMGHVMATCRRDGMIDRTNITANSTRDECHNRPLRVWRSLIVGHDAELPPLGTPGMPAPLSPPPTPLQPALFDGG